MKIYRHTSPEDNGISALKNLIGLLDLKVSKGSLHKVKNDPSYPSLSCLSNSLSDWNIENMGVHLALKQLNEIPYPAIAHLHKNKGHFVVLKKLENNQMHYIDPEIGLVKESLGDFGKKWTGMTLLVRINEKSREPEYTEKRRAEVFQAISQYGALALVGLLLLLEVFTLASSLLPTYALKIIGCVFCIMLLLKQFGNSSTYVKAFCGLGSKTDCDAVIHSAASKLFGVLYLSEIGALYFLGGLLSIIIAAFGGQDISAILFILNLLVLPFTAFSIYYQGWIVRKWCPLCLAVMAIFWLELAALWGTPISSTSIARESYLMLLSFSIPAIFWFAVRERLIASFKLSGIERNLNKFTKSEKIFKALLEQEPKIDVSDFTHEITMGTSNSPVELTLVSTPTCGPCARAHAVADDLAERFGEKIKIKYRFAINPSDIDSVSTNMVKHLTALSLTGMNGQAVKSLSNWFSHNGKANLAKWTEQYPLDNVARAEEVDLILQEHSAWCKKAGIIVTPTILINGRTLPPEYTVSDLKYHVRSLIDN